MKNDRGPRKIDVAILLLWYIALMLTILCFKTL